MINILLSVFVLILSGWNGMKTQACPPPPSCVTPGRYVMWAKEGSTVIARSENSESVYLDYYSCPHNIVYELISQEYVNGQWNTWYYSMDNCGLCNVNVCSFNVNGGSVVSQSNSSVTISYNNTLSGSVTGTHTGWSCYKDGWGSYIIQGSSPITMNAYVIKVSIASANITADNISVNLEPSGLSGNLKIEYYNPSGLGHSVDIGQKQGGSHSISFNIPTFPSDQVVIVDDIVAIWRVNNHDYGSDYPYDFDVLGDFTVTNYGIPNESTSGCDSAQDQFRYSTGDCINVNCSETWSYAKSKWLDETKENGSGKGASNNFFKLEQWCYRPYVYRDRLRRIGAIEGCPSCGTYLQANTTVAKWTSGTLVSCGYSLLIYGIGVHTVTDTGSGNGKSVPNLNRWLDRYVGVIQCNYNAGTSTRKVVKLYQ